MSHKQNIFLLSHVVLLLVILSFIDFFFNLYGWEHNYTIYLHQHFVRSQLFTSQTIVLLSLQFLCFQFFFFSVRHSDWLSLIYVSHYLCRLFLVLHVFITFFKFVSYLHSWIMCLSSLLHYYHCCSTNVVSCLFVTPSPLKKKLKSQILFHCYIYGTCYLLRKHNVMFFSTQSGYFNFTTLVTVKRFTVFI